MLSGDEVVFQWVDPHSYLLSPMPVSTSRVTTSERVPGLSTSRYNRCRNVHETQGVRHTKCLANGFSTGRVGAVISFWRTCGIVTRGEGALDID